MRLCHQSTLFSVILSHMQELALVLSVDFGTNGQVWAANESNWSAREVRAIYLGYFFLRNYYPRRLLNHTFTQLSNLSKIKVRLILSQYSLSPFVKREKENVGLKLPTLFLVGRSPIHSIVYPKCCCQQCLEDILQLKTRHLLHVYPLANPII